MRIEGERLLQLVSQSKSRIVLCAPFIKAHTLRGLMKAMPEEVELEVITRWRASEIAAGVSDLETFDLVRERPSSQLRLLNNLHAKLYIGDENCLVGSANLTGAALGWADNPNVELLVEQSLEHPSVVHLLKQLEDAEPATFQRMTELETQVAEMAKQPLDQALANDPGDGHEAGKFWLPRCAAPEKLYAIYSQAPAPVVTEGTNDDAKQDFIDLGLPSNLSEQEFADQMATAIQRMPSFQHILERIPAKLTDEAGQDLIRPFVTDMPEQDILRQWHIVREWISVFFSDRFELAPETYVLRLKPGQKKD